MCIYLIGVIRLHLLSILNFECCILLKKEPEYQAPFQNLVLEENLAKFLRHQR